MIHHTTAIIVLWLMANLKNLFKLAASFKRTRFSTSLMTKLTTGMARRVKRVRFILSEERNTLDSYHASDWFRCTGFCEIGAVAYGLSWLVEDRSSILDSTVAYFKLAVLLAILLGERLLWIHKLNRIIRFQNTAPLKFGIWTRSSNRTIVNTTMFAHLSARVGPAVLAKRLLSTGA